MLYEGLTVDFCKQHHINYIVRGLRTLADFENEQSIAHFNKQLYPEIETLFLLTDNRFSHISSSGVREIILHKGDVKAFIPEAVII